VHVFVFTFKKLNAETLNFLEQFVTRKLGIEFEQTCAFQ